MYLDAANTLRCLFANHRNSSDDAVPEPASHVCIESYHRNQYQRAFAHPHACVGGETSGRYCLYFAHAVGKFIRLAYARLTAGKHFWISWPQVGRHRSLRRRSRKNIRPTLDDLKRFLESPHRERFGRCGVTSILVESRRLSLDRSFKFKNIQHVRSCSVRPRWTLMLGMRIRLRE